MHKTTYFAVIVLVATRFIYVLTEEDSVKKVC